MYFPHKFFKNNFKDSRKYGWGDPLTLQDILQYMIDRDEREDQEKKERQVLVNVIADLTKALLKRSRLIGYDGTIGIK